MESDCIRNDGFDCMSHTSKSYSHSKARRKYNSRRDFRKSDPNGSRLRRSMPRWTQGEADTAVYGGVHHPHNPISKYFGNKKLKASLIDENLSDIIEDTKPHEIVFTPSGCQEGIFWDIDRCQESFCLLYKYTNEEKERIFYDKLKKEKLLKKLQEENNKLHHFLDNKKSHNQHKKRKLYKEEIDRNSSIYHAGYRDPDPDQDKHLTNWEIKKKTFNCKKINTKSNKKSNFYLFLDMGSNNWVTSISTKYEWGHLLGYHIKDEKNNKLCLLNGIDKYQLYFGTNKHEIEQNYNSIHYPNLLKNSNNKKNNLKIDEIKWSYMGTFNGTPSSSKYYFDYNKPFCYEVSHFINKNINFDIDKIKQKNLNLLSKNGVLCRYIKIVPLYDINKNPLKLNFSVNGFFVNKLSQPILPPKNELKLNEENENNNIDSMITIGTNSKLLDKYDDYSEKEENVYGIYISKQTKIIHFSKPTEFPMFNPKSEFGTDLKRYYIKQHTKKHLQKIKENKTNELYDFIIKI